MFKRSATIKSKGAILVMAPALILAILTIMAVAIDINYIHASKEQMQQFTKFVSLAAIEQYFATECKMCNENTPANQVCEDVISCNHKRSDEIQKKIAKLVPAYLLLNDTVKEYSKDIYEPFGDDVFNEDKIKTKYKQGRWITNQSQFKEGETCDAPVLHPPCFRSESLEYQGINAFKVETEFPFSMAARLTGPLLGVINRPIKVSAVASVVPRRTCVLIDTSASLTRETHLKDDLSSSIRGSEYAFYLQGDNPGSPDRFKPHEDKWSGAGPYLGVNRGTNQVRPNNIPPESRQHFGSDYKTKKTLSDDDYTAALAEFHPAPANNYKTDGGVYRIDSYNSDNYKGPEPLRTVFKGLEEMVDQFQARSVAGDQMCLIFYDNKLSWPRVVRLTNKFDYLKSLVEFDDLSGLVPDNNENTGTNLTNAGNLESGREKIIRHKLFPSEGSHSDTYGAFLEAMQQLSVKNVEGILTSDSIVHIGDGLANCPMLGDRLARYSDDDGLAGYCSTINPDPPYNPRFGSACFDDIANYFCAMNMLKSYVRKYIVPKGIPVHVIQVGQEVGPNTADVPDPKSDGTVCLKTEEEIRSSGLTFNYVMGMNDNGTQWIPAPTRSRPYFPTKAQSDAYENRSGAHPFYQASRDMFEIALMTKGIWGPIRDKEAGCSPTTEPTCILPPQRKKFDPQCRDTSQQIKDYMSEIMNQNPFTIVDAG